MRRFAIVVWMCWVFMATECVSSTKRRGPKVDLQSPSQISLRNAKRTKATKKATMCSPDHLATKWTNKSCCPNKCHQKYDPSHDGVLPARLMTFLAALSKTELRRFFDDRKEPAPPQLDNGNYRSSPKTQHFLEDPKLLDLILNTPTLTESLLDEPPKREFTINICSSYARYIVGNKSTNWANPKGGFLVDPPPTVRNRQADKELGVIEWFKGAKKAYLCLPTDDITVLPFSTTSATHASFVYDMELQNNPEIAKRTLFAMEFACGDVDLDEGGQNEDADPRQDLNDQFDRAGDDEPMNGPVASTRKKYRYGNALLGEKGTIPEDSDIACYTYFCKTWRKFEDCAKCIIRKWIPFTKCDCCTKSRQELKTRDADKRARIMAEVTKHILFVRRERRYYYGNRIRGRRDKDNYLSMIIDGADQSDHCMPHFCFRSHKTDAAWKMKLHLLGVIVHGIGTYTYTVPSHMAQGNNVTIQVLWETLLKIKRKSKNGTLPPILYLQLDNTTKQNKSHFLFGFLGLLVKWKVFKKIIVGFLPVGHTHEDIDQLFSRLAVYLRHNNALSRSQLAQCIRRAYKSKEGDEPVVIHWDRVANISQWLDKNNRTAKMPGLTAFHHFRIFEPSSFNGQVWLQARTWPGAPCPENSGDCWRGLDGGSNYVNIFPKEDDQPDLFAERKTIPASLRPQGQTSIDSAGLQRHINNYQNGLNSLRDHHSDSFADDHYLDCQELINLWKIPLHTPIEFNWPDKDILDMFENNPEDSEEDEEDEEVSQLIAAKVGKYYVIAPSEEDKTNHGDCPFYILRVKSREGNDCRVQWFFPHVEVVKNGEVSFEESYWGPEKDCMDGTIFTQLQLLRIDDSWAMEVELVKSSSKETVIDGGPTTTTKSGSVKDVPVKSYRIKKRYHKGITQCVFRWKATSDMQPSADDLTYQAS